MSAPAAPEAPPACSGLPLGPLEEGPCLAGRVPTRGCGGVRMVAPTVADSTAVGRAGAAHRANVGLVRGKLRFVTIPFTSTTPDLPPFQVCSA